MRRFVHAGLAVSSLVLLIALAQLSPDARGFGTHQGFRLPPCPFLTLTHVPCPSCGLTTSVVHLLHGGIRAAWRTHLAGPLMLGIILSFIGANVYGAMRPFRWGHMVTTTWFHRGIICAISWLFVGWIVHLVR